MAWGDRRRGRRARRPAGHPSGGDPGGLCRSERARSRAAVPRAQHRLHPQGLRHRRRFRTRLSGHGGPRDARPREQRDTIRNIRLWDYRPLLRTFSQIQQIRLYYQFYDVDVGPLPAGRRLPPDHAGGARADAGASRARRDLGQPPSAVHPRLRRRDEPRGAGGGGGHADARRQGPAAGGDPRRAGRQSGDLLRRAHAGLRHRAERHPRARLSRRATTTSTRATAARAGCRSARSGRGCCSPST